MIAQLRRAACLAVLALPCVALAQDRAPSRDDAADYFASVRADLYTCTHGWHGDVPVAVTFAGDGHVLRAATGDTVPAEVSSCVVSVLRGGRIRAFDANEATIDHTLRL